MRKGSFRFEGIFSCNTSSQSGIELGSETEQRYLNEIKVSTYPQIIPHITLLDSQGKSVLVFEINEYPVYFH